MSVAKGSSAMVSILDAKTDGEVVYLYDAESPRGNAGFPFKAVRLKNPTESVLESGPVTVFGDGRFIGEGLSEPIPAHSMAFVPFALDRQIVVECKDSDRDSISRILSVQRGVFSSEVQHTKRFTYTLHNRLAEPATVYVRHTIGAGYQLTKGTKDEPERIGGAHLFRVTVPAGVTTELTIEEATPIFKTIDLRSPSDMDQVRVYLSAGAMESPLKEAIGELIKMQQDLGNVEQRILTTRDQMQAYRTRMDELHAQVLSLHLVKTGNGLMRTLEHKLQDVSDKLSQATVDLAALEEKAMLLRIHFQDGVAELSLERKG
jgi:flagellar biosynthesis chaperone FliJ